MKAIAVIMRDGSRRTFKNEAASAGSVSAPAVRFEGGFVLITDARGRLTAFPASEIREEQEYF